MHNIYSQSCTPVFQVEKSKVSGGCVMQQATVLDDAHVYCNMGGKIAGGAMLQKWVGLHCCVAIKSGKK